MHQDQTLLHTLARAPRVMICEDESLLAVDLQMALEAAGAEVCAIASSRREALSLLEQNEPDLVLLDVELSDGACVDVAERLSARGVPFLIVTGFDGPRHAPPAFACSPWLLKPVSEVDLMSAVAGALGPLALTLCDSSDDGARQPR